MPRRCTICAHSERAAIDVALLEGGSLRDIARRFSLSKDSAARHRAEHLPAELANAKAAGDTVRADGLLGKVRDLEAEARRIADKAERAGDLRAALAGVRELSRIIELQAKLAGELNDSATVNVAIAPEWPAVRAAILRALEAHPDAGAAVAHALVAVGAHA